MTAPLLEQAGIAGIHAITIEERVVAPLVAKGHQRTARLAGCALSRVFKAALKDRTLGLVVNPCLGVEIGKKPRAEVRPSRASHGALEHAHHDGCLSARQRRAKA